MALPVRDQMKYWGIATLVFALVLWFLGDVLLPFVLGGAIAYFLDPVADRLERMGLSRAAATGTITVLGLVAFVVLALAVIPTLVSQALALVQFAPQLFNDLQTFLTDRFPNLLDENSVVRETLIKIGQTIQDQGGKVINTLFNSAKTVLDIAVLFLGIE